MRSHVRIVVGSIATISILMILILGLHMGGSNLLKFGVYSPLLGAFIGGCLALASINIPIRPEENVEAWARHEKLSWTLIGASCLAWGIGECFWRYYVAHGENPFPSLADIGYASFLPLVFPGLLLQRFTKSHNNRRAFLLLDSLIATGALLSIAWFLLLGPLAQSPAQSFLGKFLALYYPMADIALLSCTIFLLLREHTSGYHIKARRVSLLLVGAGLVIYAISDFSFNTLQNMGLPVDASWIGLGWPLGMMTIGLAAYTRRFLSGRARISVREEQDTIYSMEPTFNFSSSLPYLLLFSLFIVLSINVLTDTPLQESIRPVLIAATFVVISLVIIRQIITAQDNRRLMKEQIVTLEQLENVYLDVERRQMNLEAGVAHLKDIQTRLANGDVHARAQTLNGDLWPLASGLNIMADRMMRSEQRQRYAYNLVKAIRDLNVAMEHRDCTIPFILPKSCIDAPLELNHLLQIIGLKPRQKLSSGPLPMSEPLSTPPSRSTSEPLSTSGLLTIPGKRQTHPHRVALLARTNNENILSH
jgi:hypothetical protein